MHFAKDVQKKILGDNKYDSSYLASELKELGAEIKKRDWPAIKDEAGDVAYSAQMIAHQKTGLNFPMIGADGSIKKFLDRRAIWKQIFKDHGGKFHTDYLKGGSNYARPEKVQKALGMAGININDAEAAAVSTKYTEKTAADHHNVYVVELLAAALKRKKLLRDNPNADHSKPPLYVGSTGHPVEQRFSNHKSNIKGNVFVQKYGLKLRPDLYQRYNPMSFANAEAKEVELAKQLRAEGYAVVGGNEKAAADSPPIITPKSPLHTNSMLQRVGASAGSSVALQGFNKDSIGGFDKGPNIINHPFLKQHPTGAALVNMHGDGPPETPGMEVVDPKYSSRLQYTVQPDASVAPNYKHPLPAYPFKPLLPFLNKQTGNSIHSFFNESCNPQGGMTPQLVRDSLPGVTNVVAVPAGRLGAQGNDYNNPNYTNASHQLIAKALNPNSPTYRPNVTQGDLLRTLDTLTQRSAPPNMYRFENNKWVNRGAYNPAELPTAPMNNFHDDLSNNPIWKKLLSLYPK